MRPTEPERCRRPSARPARPAAPAAPASRASSSYGRRQNPRTVGALRQVGTSSQAHHAQHRRRPGGPERAGKPLPGQRRIAHDDANASYAWALAYAATIGANAAKIAVAGESAGGNLAANVPLYAKANGLRLPVHQLLVYPIAGSDFDTESYVENANAMPLSRAGVLWFGERYFRSPADAQDPRINLVGRPLTDLAGLPAATVIGAEIDPLRSEGRAYADRLDDADVRVRYRLYKRVTHEFFGTGAVVEEGREAVAYAAEGLRASFAD